jgi:hypothetical protein
MQHSAAPARNHRYHGARLVGARAAGPRVAPSSSAAGCPHVARQRRPETGRPSVKCDQGAAPVRAGASASAPQGRGDGGAPDAREANAAAARDQRGSGCYPRPSRAQRRAEALRIHAAAP